MMCPVFPGHAEAIEANPNKHVRLQAPAGPMSVEVGVQAVAGSPYLEE